MEEIAKKTEIANFVESNLAAIRPEIAKFLSAIFYKQIERKSVSDLNSFAAKNKELMVNQLKLLKEKEFEDFNSKIFDKFLRNQKKATNFEMEILKFKEKPHFQEKLSSLIKPMSFNECFESVAPKNNKIAHKNKFGFYQLDLIDKKKKSKEQKQKSYDKIKYFSDEWEKQSKEIILKNWLKQPTASLNDIFISKYSMSTIDGTKRLLEETDLKLVRGKKYGLVGLNGVGKTTLLKRISRYDVKGIPSATKILYVEQEIKGDDTTVLDFVLKSDVIREHLIARKTALIDKMKTENGEDLENHQNELSEIEEKMADFEIDKSLAKVGKILSGLGFSKKMEQTKTKHLSGGWRMRFSSSTFWLILFIF
ncbi:ATP-binding cassette sub- F member 3 [Bonamia ostreae]|uniref:ATP-binding cassette sub- F member 3 n=1 Tax=Bonamia ostreae TaxID=126728 RepID=A0ABV2AFT1_9EUKA